MMPGFQGKTSAKNVARVSGENIGKKLNRLGRIEGLLLFLLDWDVVVRSQLLK